MVFNRLAQATIKSLRNLPALPRGRHWLQESAKSCEESRSSLRFYIYLWNLCCYWLPYVSVMAQCWLSMGSFQERAWMMTWWYITENHCTIKLNHFLEFYRSCRFSQSGVETCSQRIIEVIQRRSTGTYTLSTTPLKHQTKTLHDNDRWHAVWRFYVFLGVECMRILWCSQRPAPCFSKSGTVSQDTAAAVEIRSVWGNWL